MNNNQSSENELQKAIDDITKSAANESADDAVSELEAKIQNQLGTPPTPPMPAEMPSAPVPADVPVMATEPQPVAPVAEPAPVVAPEAETPQAAAVGGAPVLTPSADFVVPAAETPVVGAPAVGETPVVGAATEAIGDDLKSVKEAMMRDLFPLMDKVNVEPKQKYEIYKEMIETTNDKSMIAGAYEAAKGLVDETARAEALLYLIEEVDK